MIPRFRDSRFQIRDSRFQTRDSKLASRYGTEPCPPNTRKLNRQSGIRNPESGIIQFILARSQRWKSRWIEVIVELQRDDPLLEINVLVGSNILASYLKRRFARTGRAMANVRFHTFLDLASRLSAVSEHAPEKRRLPNLGNSILLEDILAAHTPAVYAPLSGLPGFRAALLDTLRDLRDAGIAPQEMLDAMEADPGMKDRRRHLSGLADLYRRFRERVGFFHDVDEDFRDAIR